MNDHHDNVDGIYSLSKLLKSNEIKLSAWNQNGQKELLALYLGNGDLVYYYFTEENPIIKQIPWFAGSAHTPVSITFNPSGTFLLVLSQSCHLYVVPALAFLDDKVKNDQIFDFSDLTIYTYPFPAKLPKSSKAKSKSPSSSLSLKSSLSRQSSSSSASSNENSRRKSSTSSSSVIESKSSENIAKLKEVIGQKSDVIPRSVVWWQCIQDCQHIAIIGTKSGAVIFVDLNTGIKIAETTLKGEIKELAICQDDSLVNVFLLITIDNNEQYKLLLEDKNFSYMWPGKQFPNLMEDSECIEGMNLLPTGKGNYLPSARARLQGLKQLSVEKLATLKQKIAETRSRTNFKQGTLDDSNNKSDCAPAPENLSSTMGDSLVTPQFSRERHVLAAYHYPSQLLTIYVMAFDFLNQPGGNTQKRPLFIYKMPIETDDILLCDRMICVVSRNRTSLQIISCHLSETNVEPSGEFNPEAVLDKWDFNSLNEKASTPKEEDHSDELMKPDLIPDDLPDKNIERIISIYKSNSKQKPYRILDEYKIERSEDELPTGPKSENCLVVTNRAVYVLELKSNALKIALDLILKTQELEKAERICKIFSINLQQLLELAGDIKLANLEFPKAIALYKLSKCGLLKSIVKLSCGGHCSQVLSYSTLLLATTITDMTVTERIHLSNLVLMAYTQQILKNYNNKNLVNKFVEFLEKNTYYDKILAVSVTGQSHLFFAVHKLITNKGLILDGYNVLIKLMQRFSKNKSLQWSIDKNQFWDCITELSLIEAIVFKSLSLPVFVEYMTQNLENLETRYLDRLLCLTDPLSPFIRTVARVNKNPNDSSGENDEYNSHFPFARLVELFLLTLLVKLNKIKTEDDGYDRNLLLLVEDESIKNETESNSEENLASHENLSDEIWPIRKDLQGEEVSRPKKYEKILSSGFAHSALIRNGNVYTWGQTMKGCLGNGPTMSRHSSPLPITWLGCFKLEVSIVSCGKYHTAALTNNGVYAWGCSMFGQLGLGELTESPYPRLVPSLANENVVTIECGQYHTLALTNQGSVYACGWGVHGQLGLGSIEDERTPTYVHTLKEHVIVDIAAGHSHSLALTDKGHLYSFGSSVLGQLGTGNSKKSSVPVLVKGFHGRVTKIATGYFHSLALTDSEQLYTWGTSPQSLRLQAQAHKRNRLLQNQNNGLNSPSDPELPKPVEAAQESQQEELAEATPPIDKTETEVHLSPRIVDLKNVSGKITQISCGCHHSALVTETGELYTWGRSLDGQLGNGAQREVTMPTLISTNPKKVDAVSCGCEFTTIQEKQTGRIYSWGNNTLGQLGITVKDSTTKNFDGKIIMLKACKRVVRIPHMGSNSFDSPKEVPDIPPAVFIYHTLNHHNSPDSLKLSSLDGDFYGPKSLHYVIEKFNNVVNINSILKKCSDYGNYQAASKITLLQNKFKQSMIYQLKALQNIPKYHPKPSTSDAKQDSKDGTKTPKSELATPESEIHLFNIQGGHEGMYVESRSQDNLNLDDDFVDQNGKMEDSSEEDKEPDEKPTQNQAIAGGISEYKQEYMDHAKGIINTYLELNSGKKSDEPNQCAILETGIQFWTAEKLPMVELENFLSEKLDAVFYDLGYLLFCQQKKENQTPILHHFSSSFLLAVTSKILGHIEKNESCIDYLETMSKIILDDKSEKKFQAEGKRKKNTRNKKPKSENYVEAIKEKLKKQWTNENFINVSYRDVIGDCVYLFSCGHWHSPKSLKDEYKFLKDVGDVNLTSKILKIYEDLDCEGRVDIACPSCVSNYLKQ